MKSSHKLCLLMCAFAIAGFIVFCFFRRSGAISGSKSNEPVEATSSDTNIRLSVLCTKITPNSIPLRTLDPSVNMFTSKNRDMMIEAMSKHTDKVVQFESHVIELNRQVDMIFGEDIVTGTYVVGENGYTININDMRLEASSSEHILDSIAVYDGYTLFFVAEDIPTHPAYFMTFRLINSEGDYINSW